MKSVDAWSDAELKNLIANYRKQERTSDPYYVELLEEWARRKGGGLDFQKSLKAVLKAAQEERFLSYKQLADLSDAEWSRVRYAMNEHLGDLLEYAHRRGWPLLSAIVVNQSKLETGGMEPATLKGFVTAARALGYPVVDEQEFLTEQQLAIFAWAKTFTPNDGDNPQL